MGSVNFIFLQVLDEGRAERIIPNTPCHGNGWSLPRNGNRLVSALAAGDNGQVFTADGFARRWETRRADDQIGVQASDDEDIWHVASYNTGCLERLSFGFLNGKWIEVRTTVEVIFVLDSFQEVDNLVCERGHQDFGGSFEEVVGKGQGDKEAPGENAEE